MRKSTIALLVFIPVTVVQLYVPWQMISNKNDTLRSGVAYRFQTAPIDPNDPFRGKFIILSFEHDKIRVSNDSSFEYGEPVFAILDEDSVGMAHMVSVSKEEPRDIEDFVKCRVSYISDVTEDSSVLHIEFPFDRYYMEESMAPRAERLYQDGNRDTPQLSYALVRVKGGDAVIEDVIINGESVHQTLSAQPLNE